MSNLDAFLDAVAVSELGQEMLNLSDDGYNVIVGSVPHFPLLFDSYADHPRRRVFIPKLGTYSTAAGRYQLLERYFDIYKKQLNLPDFGKASQRAIAVQQIKERHALDDIEAGRFTDAIYKCSSIWASLPGSEYGQHTNTPAMLAKAYQSAGGVLA